jgi:hypothetical protein
MPDIDFSAIFQQLKTDLFNLAGVSFKDFVSEAKNDGQNLLESMKEKLERWTTLLAKGDLTIEDFEWLVNSQKDLAKMNALKEAGLTEIRIDQFKSSVLNLVVDSVQHALKIV